MHVCMCLYAFLDVCIYMFVYTAAKVVWLPSERRWRLYYVGYRQAAGDNNSMEDNGIGLALSEDEYGTAFVRVGRPSSSSLIDLPRN